MIVTIDGPAGAGKSSAARELAKRLNYHFLDTGAMYRAVVWAARKANVSWDDANAIAEVARSTNIELKGDCVQVDGKDVSTEIRGTEVTSLIHHVADNPQVRRHLANLQRSMGSQGNYVTEGRDQGTVVFPDADCKIFLTASAEERARRHWQNLHQRGELVTLDDVLQGQYLRDQRDRQREVGRLVPADEAIHVNTDGMTLEAVVDRLEEIVRECRRPKKNRRTKTPYNKDRSENR